MKQYSVVLSDFFKNLSKPTKYAFLYSMPIIFSLFCGGIFLSIYMHFNGFSDETARLADEMIKCCGDCLVSLSAVSFFIELYTKFN